MTPLARATLLGAAAGAAGTTALNAVTYLDMAVRGRPASSTPEDTVGRVADAAGLHVRGEERLEGLGSLSGLLAGVGTGAALGFLRGAGLRAGPLRWSALATVAALLVGNGPMTALGVTDPRRWSALDWASDVVPHLAYGAVTGYVLDRLG